MRGGVPGRTSARRPGGRHVPHPIRARRPRLRRAVPGRRCRPGVGRRPDQRAAGRARARARPRRCTPAAPTTSSSPVSLAPTTRPRVRASGSHEEGAGVTLTWLIHDVQVWRVDRVYLGAEGGPVGLDPGQLRRHEQHLGRPRGLARPRSRQGAVVPARPTARHRHRLDRGRRRAGGRSGAGRKRTQRPPRTRSAKAAAQPVAATETRWGITGLVGLVGLALGAAMTLLALRRLPFRRAGDRRRDGAAAGRRGHRPTRTSP